METFSRNFHQWKEDKKLHVSPTLGTGGYIISAMYLTKETQFMKIYIIDSEQNCRLLRWKESDEVSIETLIDEFPLDKILEESRNLPSKYRSLRDHFKKIVPFEPFFYVRGMRLYVYINGELSTSYLYDCYEAPEDIPGKIYPDFKGFNDIEVVNNNLEEMLINTKDQCY